MRLLVVGGRLQGVEAVYLAKKAGFWVRVVDKANRVPAMALGDEFRQLDVTDPQGLNKATDGMDLILPALENMDALRALALGAPDLDIPLAFDMAAYEVTRSKLASDRVFASRGIPAPHPWPACGYPVVVKPSAGSGSEGVRFLADAAARKAHFGDRFPPDGTVVQQYLTGPAYSVEVLGKPGHYTVLATTELEMDPGHDCKRVLAPSGLSAASEAELAAIGRACAEAFRLTGIMDVEVIRHQGALKVLEVDARLPSQTPITVYHASGRNEVALLADLFLKGGLSSEVPDAGRRGVVLEHIQVAHHRLAVCGEHVMAVNQPLRLVKDFFGADEALTTHTSMAEAWVATLIITGADRDAAWQKRGRVMTRIRQAFALSSLADDNPEIPGNVGDTP